MAVDEPAAEGGEELLPGQLHEACRYHQVRLCRATRGGERGVPLPPFGKILDPVTEAGNAAVAGTAESPAAVPVGADRHHPRPVGLIGARVEQGLQVGPGSGHEDDQASVHPDTITAAGQSTLATGCSSLAAANPGGGHGEPEPGRGGTGAVPRRPRGAPDADSTGPHRRPARGRGPAADRVERLLRHTGADMESYLSWPGGSGGWDSHGRPPSPDGSGTGSSRLSAQGSM